MDWAPDWMIEYVVNFLIKNHVKATWFFTHFSPAIETIKQKVDLFEIGIHPNCLPGSTQGNSEDEVLQYVKVIAPDATIMRTHGLYQSTSFLKKAALDYGILIDVSLFLPRVVNLTQYYMKFNRSGIWRVPYFWEDDYEMLEDNPIWKLSDPRLHVKGLKVFNFHPAYIVLNTDKFNVYEKLKKERPFNTWNSEFIQPYIKNGQGPKTLFLELLGYLSRSGGKWIKEIIFI